MTAAETSATVLTPAALLEHWQGHRRLTRRVIEAFPEEKLFSFSLGIDAAFFRNGDGVPDNG